MNFFTLRVALSAYRTFSTKGFSKQKTYINNKYKAETTTVTKRQIRRSKIQWTEEQKSLLSAIEQGKSVFITGSAGTGKTMLVIEVIKRLKKMHTPSKVFITASTGVAAVALKGQTLHSFGGIRGPFYHDPEKLFESILADKRAVRRWQKANALVVDECSMVDGELFDGLEYVARMVRGVDEMWGGIQMVVVGDFCQLPPIPNDSSKPVKYAFEARCWDESFHLQKELTKVFRQSDPQFIELLQRMRKGEIISLDLSLLEKCYSERVCDSSVVKLFPLKKKVMEVNDNMLKSLQKDVTVYPAVDSGKDTWKKLLNQGIAPDQLELCEGSRVMLIKNLDVRKGLVNGATGTVVGFDNGLPIVKFDSGKVLTIKPAEWSIKEGDEVVAKRWQIPLTLAWSQTIHKCQGMTLENVSINFSGSFGVGMVYTALSRVKTLAGLHLSGFKSSMIRMDPKVLEFYKKLCNKSLDTSCIESKDNSRRHSLSCTAENADAADNVGTVEKKCYFDLDGYLSRRLK
ncbi:uncharacterized protein LOC130975007 [Arachis stenosperma]|uniref:uncharacterized protein LOC130975007 n=1 Tax=Arachis stenosperma TaxID=217475 RepID=UPI0025ACE564|nr:uncharacterized protein LOC130975007 [Arachis stenosperma]